MPAPNLTRDQAKQRADLLDVASYDIELDLTDGKGGPGEKTFASTTTVRFSSARAGERTWIDLVADRVRAATLNGVELDVAAYVEDKGIALPDLAEQNELVVGADCRYMNTGEGLHRFVDPVDDSVYLYTQFETADAKRMFACFDQPDLKSVYRLTVVTPKDWKVVSNTLAESSEETPEGAVRTVFGVSERLSTYLVALITGPYAEWHDEYTDEHRTIPLGIYCRASLAEHMDAERLFTETKQGFDFYHRNFGTPYPFGKYDQLFVPEFNAGAMENAGAVTFLEDYVFRSRVTRYAYERRAETLLHEMAHMWFGDLVTMRWWDDLWLNESFATFASVLSQAEATEYKNAWTSFANIEKSWAYRQDQLPSTHPIAADIPDLQAVEVNFDGITYAKGASVLKQLVAYVGLEHFLAGLRSTSPRTPGATPPFATCSARWRRRPAGTCPGGARSGWRRPGSTCCARASKSPRTAPSPRSTSSRPARSRAPVSCARTASRSASTTTIDGKLVRTQRVEIDVAGDRTAVPELVGQPAGRLVLVNDDDLTYCAMRLDPASLTTLIDRIADITEPLPRTLCWSAAWEMTREAELKARDFVTLVQRGIHTETEVGVVQRLLLQAQTALNSYAEQGWAVSTGWPAFTSRAAGAGPGREAGLGPPAGLRELAGRVAARRGDGRGRRGLARRFRAAARPHRRHGPALAAAARAGRARQGRRPGDRRRAEARRHGGGTSPGRARAGAASHGGGQGGRVGARGPRRRADQRGQRLADLGLLAPRPEGAARRVRREVLRGDRRGVAAALERAGAADRDRAVPVVGGGGRHGRLRPTRGWRTSTRRRCGAWSPRAERAFCARWPRGTSTRRLSGHHRKSSAVSTAQLPAGRTATRSEYNPGTRTSWPHAQQKPGSAEYPRRTSDGNHLGP